MTNEQSPQLLAQIVAPWAPALDVTDLDTAQRLVTLLRAKIVQLGKAAEPSDGEYVVYLDSAHHKKLGELYERKHFFFVPDGMSGTRYWDDAPDLDTAFTAFVESAITVAWEMDQEE